MVAVPTDAPETIPVVLPIAATVGALLLHVPPGAAELSVELVPRQIVENPVMTPGVGVTVIV